MTLIFVKIIFFVLTAVFAFVFSAWMNPLDPKTMTKTQAILSLAAIVLFFLCLLGVAIT